MQALCHGRLAPLVKELRLAGLDLQITEFGRSTWYYAPNDQAKLEELEQGLVVLHCASSWLGSENLVPRSTCPCAIAQESHFLHCAPT